MSAQPRLIGCPTAMPQLGLAPKGMAWTNAMQLCLVVLGHCAWLWPYQGVSGCLIDILHNSPWSAFPTSRLERDPPHALVQGEAFFALFEWNVWNVVKALIQCANLVFLALLGVFGLTGWWIPTVSFDSRCRCQMFCQDALASSLSKSIQKKATMKRK